MITTLMFSSALDTTELSNLPEVSHEMHWYWRPRQLKCFVNGTCPRTAGRDTKTMGITDGGADGGVDGVEELESKGVKLEAMKLDEMESKSCKRRRVMTVRSVSQALDTHSHQGHLRVITWRPGHRNENVL